MSLHKFHDDVQILCFIEVYHLILIYIAFSKSVKTILMKLEYPDIVIHPFLNMKNLY